MDVVSAVLDGHRARGAFLLRCVMAPPWAIRIEDRATVCVVVVVRGTVWLVHGPGEQVRLGLGDVAVVRGSRPYVLAGDPADRATAAIGPGQVCRVLDPTAPAMVASPGERTWGNAPDGPCAFLTGTYELPSQVTGQLLAGVPDIVVVPAGAATTAARLLVEEFPRAVPGQEVVLDRLVDLVLVSALRTRFTEAPGDAPVWWRAQRDPVVAAALGLLHDRPAEPWTLATLAAEVLVSRATLARRFGQVVGQPPMAYLAQWRLSVAADLLRDPRETVEAVGRKVGYDNPSAFSTAYRRRHGVPPSEHRSTSGRAQPAQ